MLNFDKFEPLKFNTTLTELDLNNNDINNIDKLCEILQFNTVLTKLYLNNNKINNIDKLCEIIRYNTTLQYLNLSSNFIMNYDMLINSLYFNNSLCWIDIKNQSCWHGKYTFLYDKDFIYFDNSLKIRILTLLKYNHSLIYFNI